MIGAIGFGFGLTTSPILLLMLEPQTVVVVINAVAIVAFALVLGRNTPDELSATGSWRPMAVRRCARDSHRRLCAEHA